MRGAPGSLWTSSVASVAGFEILFSIDLAAPIIEKMLRDG